MKSETRVTFGLVALCFFISGAAGLIYQVVWCRYLALVLGHTSYAVIAVLVAFMGGLAVGNGWIGARADRCPRPLALYAALEIGIGIYAILFPSYFSRCHDVFISLVRFTHPGSNTLLALKFLVSVTAVLIPTVLMGATFPVLTRAVTHSLLDLRNRVAALYSINSAGAALGCLIADFWWIPSNGLEMTNFTAAALNLAAGLMAYVLSVRTEDTPALQRKEMPVSSSDTVEGFDLSEVRLALTAVGISGFVAMLYEVAWMRLLSLALGSTTHAFSLMLATFITGIAIGAWLLSRWKPARETLAGFGWAELVVAVTLFVSMFFYQYLSYWFINLTGILSRRPQAYPIYQFLEALICIVVMFIPTVCLGMTLPLASRVATSKVSQSGRSIGLVFAVNTIGTVIGTVATGLWLLPGIGLARTFSVGIALNSIVGIALLTWKRLAGRRQALLLPYLIIIGVVWLTGSQLDHKWQRAFSLGLFRAPNPPASLAAFSQAVEDIPLVFHKDGASSTVDVYSWKDEGREHRTLKINGKADAGIQTDMITQLLLGHLPLLMHPQSRQVLVIGFGSGMTCSALARHPAVQTIQAVEISPEVIEAASFFNDFNDHVLQSPKLHLAIEDAKAFLQTTDQKFDVIVSEPSNPWMAGVAAVFSHEYYENCSERLQPGGLVVQWMHVYEMTDETIGMVLRTFLATFPSVSLWQPTQGDLILIGGKQPLKMDLTALIHQFNEPTVRADLARVQLDSVPALLSHEIIPPQNGLFMVAPGPIHTDLFPALEYLAQRDLFLNQVADHWKQFREDFTPRAGTLLGQYLRHYRLTPDDVHSLARDFREHRVPEPRIFRSLVLGWQAQQTNADLVTDLWSLSADRPTLAEARAAQMTPWQEVMISGAASDPQPLRLYALDLMQAYRTERSIFYLPSATNLESILPLLIKVDPAHQRIYKLHLAEIAWDRGEDARCLELGQSALDPDITKAGPIDYGADTVAPRAVLYRMLESLLRTDNLAEAWSISEKANASGYLEKAETLFPLLEMTHRKIQAYVSQNRKPVP